MITNLVLLSWNQALSKVFLLNKTLFLSQEHVTRANLLFLLKLLEHWVAEIEVSKTIKGLWSTCPVE